MALTLNGKKRKIKKADFVTTMQASGLEEKVTNNIFTKFAMVKDRWFAFIDLSFLPDEMKEAFKVIIAERLRLLA
ncbi:MAG: HipA domain-containing protein [Paludibacteraceae bacterium]|nr:HipA domain-containing protein [Paludibacteraceae bacterium]